jgi:hypothetical protein
MKLKLLFLASSRDGGEWFGSRYITFGVFVPCAQVLENRTEMSALQTIEPRRRTGSSQSLYASQLYSLNLNLYALIKK